MNEPIFILSDARTGSTLLRVLLDTHPAICCPAELHLGVVCGTLYHVIEATLGQVVLHQSVEARTELCLAETRLVVDGLLQKYCGLKGKRRWCEKTPSNLRLRAKLRAVFPDGRYICLYRHCLDVVQSGIAMFGDMPYENRPYLNKHRGHTVPAAIEQWCDRADDLLAFEAASAATSQRVRYEDLVADPAGTLQRVLLFLDEQWWPDLITEAFESSHDIGTGDPKIAGTSTVRTDRVGVGRHLDLNEVPPALLDRMCKTLALLGYDELPPTIATTTPPSSRPIRANVAAVFDELFCERLERHRLWLRAPRHDLGMIVRGPDGGAWILQFDESGACLSTAVSTPATTIAIDSTDLLDAVNGRLTLAELRRKFATEGDVSSLDRSLIERLMQVLFGEDLRADA